MNKDFPAYPVFDKHGQISAVCSGALNGEGLGLTKLEAFTMAAMQGYCANPDIRCRDYGDTARRSLAQAKATLEALEKAK